MSAVFGGRREEPKKKEAPKVKPAPVTPLAAVGTQAAPEAEKAIKKKRRRAGAYAPVLTTPYGDVTVAPVEKKELLGA